MALTVTAQRALRLITWLHSCVLPRHRRALFIIDPKGLLRSVVINDDTVGRSVEEVRRLLMAFQFTAANDGMACPANWAPGMSL